MKTLFWKYSLGAAALLTCSLAVSAHKKATGPNVVLIVADDLGYGDVSCYGEKTIHTPNVDKLASLGLRFTDAHSTASTSTPSRYSLITGFYNWRRKDTGIAPGDAAMIISPDQVTVADIFKKADYKTGIVGKWHLGLGSERGKQDWNGEIRPGPQELGFDYAYLLPATADRVPCVWIENSRVANYDPSEPIYVSYKQPFPGVPTGKSNPELVTKQRPAYGHDQAIVNGISRIGYMKGGGKALWQDENIADTITAKAIQFIERNADDTHPFFLYVATSDIHVPRYPHPRFVGKSGMGVRGDAILEFDWTVGEIIKTLKEEGIFENTLIVLTSDNGPVVNDGYIDQSPELLGKHRPWGIYRGQKGTIYEAGTRIPFIVYWNKVVKPGISDALVSHVDLYASMASLLKVDVPNDAAGDSQDQLKAWLGKDDKGRDYIIESSGRLSVSTGEWKYIESGKSRSYEKVGPESLYNLENDISEELDIADKYPKKVAEMRAILEKEKSKFQ